MEYVMHSRNPARHVSGVAIVVIVHVVVISALMLGLKRSHEKAPPPTELEWITIVPNTLPPPPKTSDPSPVKNIVLSPIVMPIVQIDLPLATSETITVAPPDATSTTAGPTSVSNEIPATAPTLGAACPNAQSIRETIRYPALARRAGLQGDVLARFIVSATGGIRNFEIVQSSNRVFNSTVAEAVKQFQCVAQAQDVTVEVPFTFRLK